MICSAARGCSGLGSFAGLSEQRKLEEVDGDGTVD